MVRPRAEKNLPPDSIAARLQQLFDKVHPADRGPWSVAEVASMTQEHPHPISESYLWQLLRGRKNNPTVQALETLAGVFRVPIAYFFNDETAEDVQANIALAEAMRNADIRDFASRGGRLSPEHRRALAAMITTFQAVEDETRSTRGETGSPATGPEV